MSLIGLPQSEISKRKQLGLVVDDLDDEDAYGEEEDEDGDAYLASDGEEDYFED